MSEPLATPNTYDLIAAVGNLEHKAIVGGLMFERPEVSFGKPDIYQALLDTIVFETNDKPADGLCLMKYSFVPIGAVAREDYRGSNNRLTEAYRATEYGSRFGLALVGGVLTWSDAHPNYYLEEVMGPTATNGSIRSPEGRLGIYALMLERGNVRGQGAVKITNPTVQELVNDGILEYKSAYTESFDFQLDLMADPRKVVERNVTELGHAIRATVGELFDLGVKTITYGELFQRVHERYPHIPTHKLSSSLNQLRVPPKSREQKLIFGLMRQRDNDFTRGEFCELRLTQAYQGPIADLLDIIKDATEGDLAKWRTEAGKILADPVKATELYYKSRDSMATLGARIGSDGTLMRVLEGLVAIGGDFNTVEAHQNVRIEGYFGRSLKPSREFFRVCIGKLVDIGFLEVVELPDGQRENIGKRNQGKRFKIASDLN